MPLRPHRGTDPYRANVIASMTVDLPEPVGPTRAKKSASVKSTRVCSRNDAKPSMSSDDRAHSRIPLLVSRRLAAVASSCSCRTGRPPAGRRPFATRSNRRTAVPGSSPHGPARAGRSGTARRRPGRCAPPGRSAGPRGYRRAARRAPARAATPAGSHPRRKQPALRARLVSRGRSAAAVRTLIGISVTRAGTEGRASTTQTTLVLSCSPKSTATASRCSERDSGRAATAACAGARARHSAPRPGKWWPGRCTRRSTGRTAHRRRRLR